jgi:Integrase core domain
MGALAQCAAERRRAESLRDADALIFPNVIGANTSPAAMMIGVRPTNCSLPGVRRKTLKQEEVDGRSYRDAHQAREMIGSFIQEVYNRQRLHSALAYQSPTEFEANLQEGAVTTASRSLATALWGARSLAACCTESNHRPGSAAAPKQTPIATCP